VTITTHGLMPYIKAAKRWKTPRKSYSRRLSGGEKAVRPPGSRGDLAISDTCSYRSR
jgi:hypothetical protein